MRVPLLPQIFLDPGNCPRRVVAPSRPETLYCRKNGPLLR